MNELADKLNNLLADLDKAVKYFYKHWNNMKSVVQIYTHIDADGISAGAIIGKALYRANIPFQIRLIKQLEREEIIKIAKNLKDFNNFLIFTDFGSGQYLNLKEKLSNGGLNAHFIVLDHHIPQGISSKEEVEKLKMIHEDTTPWHINPYFYDIDGSTEISGSGMSYYFAKCLDKNNIDLSKIALIGAVGDIQNRGKNKMFYGLNKLILDDATENNYIDILDDLNFSSLKPLHEAIAYSSDIQLPGLSKNPNKTLKFLQTLGILMENSEGEIRTLGDLDKLEKQKISTAVIEYASLKLDLEPVKVYEKLIVNKYVINSEQVDSQISDISEFSNLLNSCGRTGNGSLGIAIAMGDRNKAYQEGLTNRLEYRRSIMKGINWLTENEKIQHKDNIQYYFGEEEIPESIIGVIATILIFDNSEIIDIHKPLFGLAKRDEEDVYKVSGRAHEKIVKKGINLSEAIREALELNKLEALGGGHPPAAGTKVPINKIEQFLDTIDGVIKKQLENTEN